MLFTTNINLAISRSVRGRNSGVDRVCNGKTNHDRRAINRFREENGFDKKKAEETYVGLVGLFLQETMPILVTYHPRNGSPEEWNEKQSISAL